MTRLAALTLVVAICLIGSVATSAAGPQSIPVTTTITLQAPQWSRSGRGVTFVGNVDGGPGCTMGRRVGLYQDGYQQISGFVRTGAWTGHSQGYWNITVNIPGRAFTTFHAVVIQETRSPSFAKPNKLICKYAISRPMPNNGW
jgi:hypothetical protein